MVPVVQNLSANAGDAGDVGSIPKLGRSSGRGNDSPLQCSLWEIPRTKGPGRLQFMGSPRVGHD